MTLKERFTATFVLAIIVGTCFHYFTNDGFAYGFVCSALGSSIYDIISLDKELKRHKDD